jgi:hypothetical protein
VRLYRELAAWLVPVALNTGKGPVLVSTLLEEMRHRQIIAPPLAVSERLCSEARSRAERQTFQTLTESLSADCLTRLDGLLAIRLDTGNQSWLAWLRQPATMPRPKNILKLIERLEHVRGLGIDSASARMVHSNRLTQIAREGAQSTLQHLADLEPLRRHATLAAVTHELETTLTDEIIDLFDRIVGLLFRKNERRHAERFHASGRAINEKVRLYAVLGRALLGAKEAGRDPWAAVDQEIGWDRLRARGRRVRAARLCAARVPEGFFPTWRAGEV